MGEFVDIRKFDALFDRGCFHTVPTELTPQYAKNVAGLAIHGAAFLMLYKTPPIQGQPLQA